MSTELWLRHDVLGMRLDALTREQAVEVCLRAVRTGRHLEVGVLNAAKVVRMRRDEQLWRSLVACGLMLADGQSVVWASRLLGRPLPERVAGIDLFTDLLAAAARDGHPVYLLGARPEVVQTVAEVAVERWPGLVVAGARDGFFGPQEAGAVADEIRASGARLLFLGMTTPKKELFVEQYGERSGAHLVHGVGGSFDVLAGVVERAPLAWQKAGFEWLHRVLQEPRRMALRYLTTNIAFLALLAREVCRERVLRRPTVTFAPAPVGSRRDRSRVVRPGGPAGSR